MDSPKLVPTTELDMIPIRIQITCYHVLKAEVIVHQRDADRTWAHYTQACYRKGIESGGAVMCRADLPRTFEVPVGGTITDADCIWNRRNGNVEAGDSR